MGGRSSDWIDEVATTVITTTTTAPATTHPVEEAIWVNDFDLPEATEAEEVLSAVFARSGGGSRFLQASREEIVAVLPELLFPAVVPAAVTYITSQLVIENQTLELANDPTTAFGLWSVEPYTRSRSIGQLAVLNVATDPSGATAAADAGPGTCAAFDDGGTTLCVSEQLDELAVWRLESASGVTHLWYDSDYRYELFARGDVTEEVVHQMVGSLLLLSNLPGGTQG